MKICALIVKYFIVLVATFLLVAPIYFLIIFSLFSNQEVLNLHGQIRPKSPAFHNYAVIIDQQFWIALGWTLAFSLFSVTLKNLILLTGSYGLSGLSVTSQRVGIVLLIILFSIPEITLYSGWYKDAIQWNMNTYLVFLPLSAPLIIGFFSFSYFFQAIVRVKQKYHQVFLVDHLKGYEQLLYVYWHQLKIPLTIATIFGALASWNSYLWPNILSSHGTVQLLGQWFRNLGLIPNGQLQNLVAAGAVISLIIPLSFYWINHKWINKNFIQQK